MPSYVVTGVSRGLGFEFLRQLSSVESNTVVGLVRNKTATEASIAKEFPGRKNIHILEADVSDYEGLRRAAVETASITGGGLDYLIGNAASLALWSAYDGLYKLGQQPKKLEDELLESLKVNVIGQIHLINLFLPLILKGNAKKVIVLGTGHADDTLINKYELEMAAPYSISKAALNTTIAKYNAELGKEGVLFLSVSPGYVETGQYKDVTEEQLQSIQAMGAKFAQYAPHFTGPITPHDSIKAMLSVIENATPQKDGGQAISHLGNRQWL